ncbi:MAG TPA: SPASM domain-containing protein [Conexivisphaerales archaeon]|nr:SPASM domain-containing protein [Conexivisphaerales archaeon]
MNFNHPDTYCRNPFIRLEVGYQGAVWLCCPAWLPLEIGNIMDNDLLDLWHGKIAQEIRMSVRDGSYRHCTSCPFLPGPQGTVVPWGPAPDTDVIDHLYLSYDKTCNLACPSCRKGHLSLSEADHRSVAAIQSKLLASGVLERVNILHLSGSGDPLASHYGRELLRQLSAERFSGLRVGLCTNGLLCTPELWGSLSLDHLNLHEIQISVDAACAETYAKNRGGDWNRLLANLDFINSEKRSRQRPFELHAMFVVQENNFHEMPAFLDLMTSHGVDCVAFMEIRDWFNYLKNQEYEADYSSKAVQLASHPRHPELLSVLEEIRQREPHEKVKIYWMGFNRP